MLTDSEIERLQLLSDPPEWFAEFVDLLLSDEDGSVVMLKAYFDASGRESGLFCVAGYLFHGAQAKKFAKEWSREFDKYDGFHMTGLQNLKGNYRDVSPLERDRLTKRAVQIIRRRITSGVVVSCWTKDIDRHSPKFIRGFSHAYPVLCHVAMGYLGQWVQENRRDDIAYMFETGDPFQAQANDLMSATEKSPELKEHYRYRSGMSRRMLNLG